MLGGPAHLAVGRLVGVLEVAARVLDERKLEIRELSRSARVHMLSLLRVDGLLWTMARQTAKLSEEAAIPKLTDTDLNKAAEQNIIWTQNVDCPECDTTTDAVFDTGAKDEDGLADLVEGDVTAEVTCPNCGHKWAEEYSGWQNYGDA